MCVWELKTFFFVFQTILASFENKLKFSCFLKRKVEIMNVQDELLTTIKIRKLILDLLGVSVRNKTEIPILAVFTGRLSLYTRYVYQI